jgi:hypothetical protein
LRKGFWRLLNLELSPIEICGWHRPVEERPEHFNNFFYRTEVWVKLRMKALRPETLPLRRGKSTVWAAVISVVTPTLSTFPGLSYLCFLYATVG